MVPVIHEGREWTLYTINKDDALKSPGGPRAQYLSLPFTKEDFTHQWGFDLIIPYGWKQNKDYVNFHDLHCRMLKGLSYAFYVVENKFRAVIHSEPAQKGSIVQHYMDWEIWKPYEFRLTVNVSTQRRYGYINCKVNGEEWFHYKGPTMFEGDQSPYWKVGPYQATPNWKDPDVNNRRMMIRV